MPNDNEETLSSIIHDTALGMADRLRPRLLELENAGKSQKAEIVSLKEAFQKDVEYYLGQISGLTLEVNLLQERVAEFLPRPPLHQHDPDEPNPVITLDFDGTCKPQMAQGDGGNYPIDGEDAIPFPKLKYWLDRWKARKTCIHVATAGLYYGSIDDLEVFAARFSMLNEWKARWGIPVDIFLPKVPSDIYYDDRMTVVPGDPTLNLTPKTKAKGFIPDWDLIGIQVEADLGKRFDLIDGVWIRKDKKRVGVEIEEWPDIADYPVDHPRGYSGPRIDVDMHRTLSLASSSLRVAPLRPGAREALLALYNLGVTIRISCAGWNPKTHKYIDAMRRLAGIRMYLLQNSVPYDRIVTKDHADAYIDDKGFRFTDWESDRPAILKRLPIHEAYRHGD